MELFKVFGTLALEGADNVNKQLDDTTKKAESSTNSMAGYFNNLLKVIGSVFAVHKIKEWGTEIVQTAANVQAETAQFEAAFKDLAGGAEEMFQRVGDATGVMASRLKVTGTKAFSQLKGAGLEANDALGMTETFLNLASDAAAYYDISLEDSEARIRSFMRGNVEAGDAIGLFTSESQRNAKAVEMYGRKWIELSEAEKQVLMLNVASTIYEQSGALGQAQREADGLANITGNLKETWRQFIAVVGSPVLKVTTPIIQSLTAKITEMQGKVEELKVWISNNSETIELWKNRIINAGIALAAFVVTLKTATFIQNVSRGFQEARLALQLYTMQVGNANVGQGILNGTLKLSEIIVGILTGKISITTAATNLWQKAQQKLNTTLAANPVVAIVLAITALVAVFAAAYKSNEEFRLAVNALWESLKESFLPVLESIIPLLTAMGELFKSIWNLLSSLLIPVFNALLNTITTVINAVMPILQMFFNVASKVFEGIAQVVTKVVNVITSIVQAITKAVNAVKAGVEKIKGFFNFNFKWPKLSLPKFSVKPEGWKIGDLLKGKIPKLGITWNAEGAIFDKPTIFDTANGYQGVGEAGPEAVAPIDTLLGYVKTAVREENSGTTALLEKTYDLLAKCFPEAIKKMDRPIVLDTGALVGEIAPIMDASLGNIYNRRERGN